MRTEEVAQALKNAGIKFSQHELEEVAQNYALIKDGLEEARVKLDLEEKEPDFIPGSVNS